MAVTKRRGPVVVFLGLAAASLAALLLLPPILQDQSYHRFADERTLFGIPNFSKTTNEYTQNQKQKKKTTKNKNWSGLDSTLKGRGN